MNRLSKIILLVFITFNLISCNENYPKRVSQHDGCWNINSRYEIATGNFNEYPKRIQQFSKNYLINNIGPTKFAQSTFTNGYIFSDKPITFENDKNEILALLNGEKSKELKALDNLYDYPVYCIGFEYVDLKKGIEKIDLNFTIDTNGNIIQHIAFPKINPEEQDIIPIDSIHSILLKRKISSRKLEIDLRYNREKQASFYHVRTFIRSGSIFGPSCFPEYHRHFKVNAVTAEIIEFDPDNPKDYYDN